MKAAAINALTNPSGGSQEDYSANGPGKKSGSPENSFPSNFVRVCTGGFKFAQRLQNGIAKELQFWCIATRPLQ